MKSMPPPSIEKSTPPPPLHQEIHTPPLDIKCRRSCLPTDIFGGISATSSLRDNDMHHFSIFNPLQTGARNASKNVRRQAELPKIQCGYGGRVVDIKCRQSCLPTNIFGGISATSSRRDNDTTSQTPCELALEMPPKIFVGRQDCLYDVWVGRQDRRHKM